MVSCCCWVLCRWWLVQPLVYRCLLGMADLKAQLTLLQLATWRFLNDRAEIFIWFDLYLSVVFMVIGHWELMVEFKWENKNSNAGNSFVKLLVVTSSLSSFWQVSIGVGLLQGQYPALWFVCYVLEVMTALIALHTDMFLCFHDVTKETCNCWFW